MRRQLIIKNCLACIQDKVPQILCDAAGRKSLFLPKVFYPVHYDMVSVHQ
jgi:hypothetical protein